MPQALDGADQTLTVVTGVGGCVGTGGRSAPGRPGRRRQGGVAAGADEPADNPAGSRGADHDRRNGEAPASMWPGRPGSRSSERDGRSCGVSRMERVVASTDAANADTRRSARGAATAEQPFEPDSSPSSRSETHSR